MKPGLQTEAVAEQDRVGADLERAPFGGKTIQVKRTGVTLTPDRSRVMVRPFDAMTEERATRICARVLALTEEDVQRLLAQVLSEFGERHQEIRRILRKRFTQIQHHLLTNTRLSEERQLLLGAYFTHEYALEAAALFNPSIVPHPDQTSLSPGALRFVLSLRATGEGHISSITFRTGVVDIENKITINPPTRFLCEPQHIPNAVYEKALFERKVHEIGLASSFSRQVLGELRDLFTLEELKGTLTRVLRQVQVREPDSERIAKGHQHLAESNYEVEFDPESRLSERVIFPSSPSQRNGIEDARFVRFHNDDESTIYYATYTAYDGKLILPQFLETPDFLHFKFITLNGPAVLNKGMALFPRKVNGLFAMLSRQDNENIYLMYSEDLHFWYSAQILLKPTFPWEFVQLGNCGSPIETEAGWLVLSHGVGPMRKYCIGAFLLDLRDPSRVIARLREPLLQPAEAEREGYVPNVVYSCGALLHNRELILPYAMSDYATSFATVSVDELLAAMEWSAPTGLIDPRISPNENSTTAVQVSAAP